MLYRVQEIVPPKSKPVLIGEAAIKTVRRCSPSEHNCPTGYDGDCVEVWLLTGLVLYCEGTLETFAVPWEPAHEH